MKIDNNVKPITGGTIQQESGRAARQPAADTESRPSADVKLSTLSSQLQMAEKGLADTPVVNAARVAELKQAISEGRFKVNADAVADRLLDTVRELIRTHKG